MAGVGLGSLRACENVKPANESQAQTRNDTSSSSRTAGSHDIAWRRVHYTYHQLGNYMNLKRARVGEYSPRLNYLSRITCPEVLGAVELPLVVLPEG